jgi:16S rRNA processing protein RimM
MRLPQQRILMGVVGRPHGVRGLLRVHSYTADPADLPAYGPFRDDAGRSFSLRWRGEGIAELAELVDGRPVPVTDRSRAEKLVNVRLYADRDRLPPAGAEEYYLADLLGLQAVDAAGNPLGQVDAVHDYGAGTSLEIASLLVPFTRACVPVVDIAGGRLIVVPPEEIAVPGGAEDAA